MKFYVIVSAVLLYMATLSWISDDMFGRIIKGIAGFALFIGVIFAITDIEKMQKK